MLTQEDFEQILTNDDKGTKFKNSSWKVMVAYEGVLARKLNSKSPAVATSNEILFENCGQRTTGGVTFYMKYFVSIGLVHVDKTKKIHMYSTPKPVPEVKPEPHQEKNQEKTIVQLFEEEGELVNQKANIERRLHVIRNMIVQSGAIKELTK